jgi:starvation-inducible DNA-binding protein
MKVNIGLSDQDRKGVIDILNVLLADEYVLYTNTRNYHWNVVGPQFHDLHKLFESQYEALNEVVDDVAERVRTMGGTALGSLAEFLKQTRLKEHAGESASALEMVRNLLLSHEALIQSLRVDLERAAEKCHDIGTNDFLTGLMERHEKMAWLLRAMLEGK